MSTLKPKPKRSLETETETETVQQQVPLQRAATIAVRQQKYDDCAIYAIANVFMRRIVLLLDWDSQMAIDWDETDPNTCDKYNPRNSLNPQARIQYKYCILYAYIQRILRKNFGSTGVYGEPVIRSFCSKLNEIMSNPISKEDSITTDINTEAQNQALIDQYESYITILESTKKRTAELDIELANYKRRLSELRFALSDEHETALVGILTEIRRVLAGRVFDMTIYEIQDRSKPTFQISRETFLKLQNEFIENYYGILFLEVDDRFIKKLQSIKNNSKPGIINQIMETARKRDRLETEGTDITAINEELTNLLDDYLNLSSGLGNANKNEHEPINMFDTFVDMINTHQTSMDHDITMDDGHDVTIQYMFYSDIEPDLGYIYCVIKNTWSIGWGIYGYLVVPLLIFWYANVKMFDIISRVAAEALARESDRARAREENDSRPTLSAYIFEPGLETVEILKSELQRVRRRLGGKRSRKKHRKRTCRKRSCRKRSCRKISCRKKHKKG
jgi:hypothetical protein